VVPDAPLGFIDRVTPLGSSSLASLAVDMIWTCSLGDLSSKC
jgi:hypothetical protein